MRLFALEVRKIVSSAAILGFVVLCLAFNALSIGNIGQTRETAAPTNIFEGYKTAYIAEAYINALGLDGSLADAMRGKYAQMQAIVDVKAQSGDALGQYTYEQHQSLFERTMFPLLLEGIILAVLIMLLALGYENINRTEQIVYSTRVGRRVIWQKGAAAIAVTLGAYALITAVTLAKVLHGCGDLLRQNVSSCFNPAGDIILGARPFMTWQSFTVLQYLWAVVGVSIGLVLAFSLTAFVVGAIVRNSYAGFIVVFMGTICCIFLPPILPSSYAKFLFAYTPIWLSVKLPIWFTDGGSDILWRNFETWGTCVSLAALALGAVVAGNQFKRRDIL